MTSPHRTRTRLLLVAGVAALLAGNFATKDLPGGWDSEVDQAARSIREARERVGSFPPDFDLPMLDGTRFRLADRVGRGIVVVNFFATWCEPCRREMPEFLRYFERHRKEPFEFVAIDVDEKVETVRAFVERQKLSFPVAIDDGGTVARAWGVDSYPTTFVIGADGRIALLENGAIANADVVFDPLLAASREIVARRAGIGRDEFLASSAREGGVSETLSGENASVARLEGSAKTFADKLRCPDCDKSLAACGCTFCRKTLGKIRAMSCEGRSDADLLQELFFGKEPTA